MGWLGRLEPGRLGRIVVLIGPGRLGLVAGGDNHQHSRCRRRPDGILQRRVRVNLAAKGHVDDGRALRHRIVDRANECIVVIHTVFILTGAAATAGRIRSDIQDRRLIGRPLNTVRHIVVGQRVKIVLPACCDHAGDERAMTAGIDIPRLTRDVHPVAICIEPRAGRVGAHIEDLHHSALQIRMIGIRAGINDGNGLSLPGCPDGIGGRGAKDRQADRGIVFARLELGPVGNRVRKRI